MASKTSFSYANIVKNTEKLLTGTGDMRGLETPDIGITDDIGECEGFKELVLAKLTSTSEAGIKPELNADRYSSFDPNKISHEFMVDYKYKDIGSAKNLMSEYEIMNNLYGYSQSFDSLVGMSIDDGIELRLKSILSNYKKLYDGSVKLLNDKLAKNRGELDNVTIRTELENLLRYDDMEITAVVQDVVSPSSTYPGTMVITYGPYYRMLNANTPDKNHKHAYDGIDIALTRNDIVRSIEAGTVVQVKTSFGQKGDTTANFVSIKSDIDETVVTYRHVSGKLQNGNKIAAGAIIGQFDSSGLTKEGKPVGAHLHMDAKTKEGTAVKILPYIAKRQPRLKMLFADTKMKITGTVKSGSPESVGISVANVYKAVDSSGYNLVMERSKIVVDEKLKGIQATSSFILKDNNELQNKITSVLTLVQAKIENIFKDIFEDRMTSIYKIYTYDFSKKVEDVNINIIPGSSGRIMIQGENAPFIQSTGGRTKSATVTFTINSIIDLTRLSMLFKVVNATDHQVSMLMMTRSAYKAGQTKSRLRHIADYMAQENFNRTIRTIIGKKLPPRFDEPVTIRNEFLNAMGISSCIPTSFEIKTMDDNPGAYQVIINFNAINLGNRNLENLKKLKVGSNIPILPLATRLSLRDNLNNEVTASRFDEKKLVSVVGTMAAKQALAEFLPIYIISKIKRFKDNVEAVAANDSIVDMDNSFISSMVLSNRGFDNNISVIEKVIDETTRRNVSTDISFNTYGESVTDAVAFGASVYGQVKAGRVGSLTSKAKLISEVKSTAKTGGIMLAMTGATVLAADTAAAISDNNYAYTDQQQNRYLNFNLLTLLPVYLNDLIAEYFSHIKSNDLDDFILTCAEECSSFIDNVMGVGAEENVISRFSKPVKVKADGKENIYSGIRLFINAAGYSLEEGVKDAEKRLKEAGAVFQAEMNGSINAEDGMQRIVHLSALTLNYWAISLTKEINQILIDLGGKGIVSAVVDSANPSKSSVTKIASGLNGIKATTTLLRNTSIDIYVKQVRDAITSVITSAQIDTLIGYFLTGDTSSAKIPADSDNKEYNIYIEKLKMTQTLGYQVCKKYELRPEVLSGNIVTDEYASGEVRQFAGYTGMIIMQMISKKLIAGDTVGDIKLPSMADTMSIILPDRAKALFKLINHFCKKVWQFINEYNIIWVIVCGIIVVVLTKIAAVVGTVAAAIISIVITIVRRIQLLIEWGSLLFEVLMGLFKKGANIVLRKGNLLKISVYLTNLIRAGISHSTLIEIGVETRIWFKDLLYYGSDINDQNQTSYIDFPVFTYLGEAMMPDFWVNKIGFIEDSYKNMMETIDTISQMVMENQDATTSNDYRTLLNKFKDRLSGVDSSAVKRAELEFHNNLKHSIREEYGGIYFGPAYNDTDPRIVKAADHVCQFGNVINSYVTKYIGKQAQSFNFGYVYIRAFTRDNKKLSDSMKYSIDASRCALLIDVTPDYCKITPNKDMAADVVKAISEARNTGVEEKTSFNMGAVYDETMAKQAISTIVNLLNNMREMNKTKAELMDAMEADTISNLMMLKTLVGSAMSAVGKPGIAYMKSLMVENTRQMIRSALYMRAGYQYPTLKLFFIEEDSEAYYLFDDLYSYASIIDFSMSDDLDSPVQVLKLNVTNIYGNLDDVSSDRLPEYSFANDHDPSSSLNSIMLKTGCKIKLQAGYTTLMDEGCTIFTGRISNIQFGEITQIEATSMGDSFLEEVSLEKIKIYGDDFATGDNALQSLMSYVMEKVGNVFGDGTYETPLSSIKKIVGYVLTDATLKGKLDDYTISPELQADFDREVSIATSDYMASIKNKFFPNVIDKMFNAGGMTVKTSVNKQLFENINISDGGVQEVGGIFGLATALRTKSTIWTSLNQTTWDILQEINMLLPNHMIRVLPYETRSTLVWGSEYGFYRYKKSSDFNTMVSTALADKLRFSIEPSAKFQLILKNIMNNLQSGTAQGIWDPFEYSMALLLLIVDYANALAIAYSASKDNHPSIDGVKENIDIFNTKGIKEALSWAYLTPDTNLYTSMVTLLTNHQAVMLAYNEAVDKGRQETTGDATRNIPLSDISTDKLIKPKTGTSLIYDGGPLDYRENSAMDWRQSMVLKMIFLEFAAEYYLDMIFKTSASTSTSYKRISDVHIKMSGRDIVRNNIMLMEPYNAVKVTYPSTSMEDVVSNLEEDSRSESAPIPIHYKLEPRVWKVYSTFFRNINVFPSARNSVLAMFTSNCLTNLIKQSYGGNIIILGDQNIKSGDRVFIYDENTDLYGFIEVAKIVHIFSREQGFVSVITPAMVARTESVLKEFITDILGNLLETVKYIVLVGLILKFGAATKNALSKSDKFRKATDFIDRKLSFIKTGGQKAKALIRDATKDKLFGGTAAERALRDFEKTEAGSKQLSKLLNELANEKIAIEKMVYQDNIVNIMHNRIVEETTKYLAQANLQAVTIRLEEIADIVKKASDVLYDTANRTNKNISVKMLENIEANLKTALGTKIQGADIDELTRRIISAIKSQGTVKGAPYSSWSRRLDEGFVNFDNKTKLIGTNITVEGSTDLNSLKEGILTMTETFAFNKKSVLSELGGVALRAGKDGFAYMVGSELVEAIRDISDLALKNELTAHSVTVTPLFFRGEPFVSNLDGMDKRDGEQAGIIDIMKTRSGQAMRGLASAVNDPMEDLVVRYNKQLADIAGKENLGNQYSKFTQ